MLYAPNRIAIDHSRVLTLTVPLTASVKVEKAAKQARVERTARNSIILPG